MARRVALPFLFLALQPGPKIGDVGETPDTKIRNAVALPRRFVAEGGDLLGERLQFLPGGLYHITGSEAPRHDIGHKIGDLNSCRQIAVNEKRLRDDQPRPQAPCRAILEVAMSLVDQDVAL